ncbi:hypothetical protein FRB93_008881 [Tulasnella sp. JGI-2019a]|nr:hypothetical protein FRB93_008881 [Tulasnella sp. JGI-2019a]
MGISIDVAHLLGWAIGMAFYGLYAGLFAITMWVLRNHQHNRGLVYWGIVGLFIISTVQTFICCAESYDAWINHAADPGPGAWFIADGNPWQPVKDTFVYLGTVFADSLVCWRLYVVWSQQKRILIVPILLLCGSTISGALVVYYEARTVQVNADTYLNTSSNLTIVVIVCTLLMNLLTTSLIAGRLWWINRQVQHVSNKRSSRYRKVMAAIIESGSLYTLTMLILIILYGAGSVNGVYLAAYIVPMVIGIFPTLIVLQVNITPRVGMETTRGVAISSIHEDTMRFNQSGGSKTQVDDKATVQIHVDVDRADKSDPAAESFKRGRDQHRSLQSLATSSVPERRNMARRDASLDLSISSDDDKDADFFKGDSLNNGGYAAPELMSGVRKSGTYVSTLGEKPSDDVEMATLPSPRSAL